MPDSALQGVSSEVVAHIRALEDLVARLAAALHQNGIVVKELQKQVREGKRQAAPFRRQKKKRKKDRKRPGRKGGHPQARRDEPKHVDETDEARHADRCSCGGCLETVDVYEQIQEDVEPQVTIRKLRIYVGQCTRCRKTQQGRSPYQTSTARGHAERQIGPTALALAADLHFGQGVPYDKVREHLAHLGIKVATSTVVRAMDRIAGRLKATFQELMRTVLSQDVIHIDETGWYVDGEPHWLWVITGAEATIYFVRRTRSSDEVADFLKDFAGIFVSDGAKAYDKLAKTLLRALCLLHLRRNVRSLEQEQTKGAVRFPRRVIAWLDDVIELVGRREAMGADTYQRAATELEEAFATLLQCRVVNAANAKLLKRLETWQDAVLRCLRDVRVPATNNHAERQVRPAVPIRKRSGGNRSARGARTFERLTSILVSCRQKGVDTVRWLIALLRQKSPRAPRTICSTAPIALLPPAPVRAAA